MKIEKYLNTLVKLVVLVVLIFVPLVLQAAPYVQNLWDTTAQSQLPQPVNVVTNYPNVATFMAANTNLSTEAQSELNGYSRELTQLGQLTNLVDLIPFNPRFNPGSNSLTLMGRTVWCSNVVWTAHGVSGVNGGQIIVSNMPDLRTNTLVVTWRFPNSVSANSQYFLAGAVDPVSFNSEWIYGGPWPSAMITQSTTQPAASAGVWNEFMGASYSFNYWSPRQRIRHVSVLSSSNGVFQAWDNGVQCLLTTSPTAVYNSGVTLANPLTALMIFNAPGIQGGIAGGMSGEIESVQVFKGAATSNMVLAAWWGGNELENENTWYTFITDSQGSPDEVTTPYTNCPVYYMMQNGNHNSQVCWDHWGLTGQFNFDYTNAIEVYRITTLYAPHGRFSTERLTYALNINDLYNGWTAATIWPFYTNLSATCLASNVQLNVVNTAQLSTSNYPGNYVYTQTIDNQRILFNQMLLTNSFLFAHIIDKNGMVSQNDLITNNLFTVEGLHFTGPLGWTKNQQFGTLMDTYVNQTIPNFNVVTSSATGGIVIADTGVTESDTYLSSGSTITAITWQLPTSGTVGQRFYLHTKSIVTTLTVTGGSFNDAAVVALTAGQTIGYQMQTTAGAYNRIE